MSSSRALVIGAGISGLTLAIVLARKGITAEVTELTADANILGIGIALGASGQSSAKRLSMFKRRARARGRRLAWRGLWCGSGGRWVLGCVDRGLGGEVERRQGGV